MPREEWKSNVRVVVPDAAEKVPAERKTGLEPAVRALCVRDGGLDVLRRVA